MGSFCGATFPFGLRISASATCLEIVSIALGAANAKIVWEIVSDIWPVTSWDFTCSWWWLVVWRASIRRPSPTTWGGLVCPLKLMWPKTWRLHSTLFCIVLGPSPWVRRSSSFSYFICYREQWLNRDDCIFDTAPRSFWNALNKTRLKFLVWRPSGILDFIFYGE